jgi:hypothetical protein
MAHAARVRKDCLTWRVPLPPLPVRQDGRVSRAGAGRRRTDPGLRRGGVETG